MVRRLRIRDLTIVLLFCITVVSPTMIQGREAIPAPQLSPPTGRVVNVSTEAQLQTAVQQLASDTTIVLAPGTYQLTSSLYIDGTFTNVAITGGTDTRDDVVLQGPGMANASDGNVPYGIWTGGNVQGITIANLTIRDVSYDPIIFNAGTQSPHVYNVHLIDAGEEFIKSNPDGIGGGVNNGIVEYSVIEYTTTSKDYYTNGIDVHTGANWIIRHNLFRNIVAPAGQLAGPAVLIWNYSANTVTEGNTFLNCARAIAYGLEDKAGGFDHSGGIIRNNFVYRSSAQPGDVGIGIADSPNTKVLNNTVFLSGTYSTPIEYRFASTTGVVLENNLLDGSIWARDGATGTVQNNLTGADAELFVNASAGDLHLAASATAAIDHGLTLTDVTDDWDGQLRPSGPAYDIGADEYQASDTTAPTVSMTAPANGATLSGTSVTISAAASDNVGVVGVQFRLDGVNLGAEITAGLYTGTWNATTSSNGSHTLTAVARDAAGNLTTALPVTVTVNNTMPDTTPPTVSMTTPASGATVSGRTVTVSATAADNVGVAGVQFLLDGAPLGAEGTTAPYSFAWDTTTASNGGHTLAARARDTAGNQTTSAPVTVTIANAAGAPATDAVAFGDRGTAALTVTTSAFSTTAANELLLAFVAADDPTGTGTTVASVTGAGLTWQLVKRTNAQRGPAEIWRTFASAALTSVTVKATLSQAAASSLTVVSFTGVDPSGSRGSGAIGATASGTASTGAPTATLVTTRSNSRVFGVGNDFDNAIARTLGANQSMVHQYMPPVGDTYWVQRMSGPTPISGTSVTINDSAPTGDRYNLTICEILAPPASDTTPPTVSMTAPANGTTVSGTAVTVSAAAADNVGVARVQFKVDGVNLGTEDTASPYASTWNTTTASNGSHTLTAVARDAAGNTSTATAVTVTVNNASSSSTIWNASATPSRIETSDTNAIELGVRFRADVNGSIGGVRFYKGTGNTGTHVGNLWTNTGTLLATATFSNETASGWQQVTFSSPVAVTANTTYAASYHTNVGQYAVDNSYFATTGVDNAPLHALADGVGGANGVYAYGASAFPTQTYQSSNYWVDVVFTASGGGDTTPPTVSMTAPANGATVSGSAVTISATAADNIGVVGVQFKLDGANLGAEDTASPYTFSWNTTTTGNGSHGLTAVARDAAGNSTTAIAVTVTVDNTAPDMTPPTVSMTAPADGATVSGSAVTVSATASDNVGVVGVQFKLDGANLGVEEIASPYINSWDTTTTADGTHTLTAVARDAVGNTTTSAAVTVIVSNTASTPPTTIVFQASADHNNGVTSYLFEVFANGAGPNSASPVASSDLGKPTPDGNDDITVDRTSFFSGLAPGTYIMTVSAIGPSGQGRSAPVTVTW